MVQQNSRKSTVIIPHLDIPRLLLLQCVRDSFGYVVVSLIYLENMSMSSLSLLIIMDLHFSFSFLTENQTKQDQDKKKE